MIADTMPLLHYFESGNIFSGSYKNKRYKVFPDGENMLCKVWLGEYCLEVTLPEQVSDHTGRQTGYDRLAGKFLRLTGYPGTQ